MLTKDQIKKHLKEDPYWELPDDATTEEWIAYDEAYEELEAKGELNFTEGEDIDDWDDDE